MHSAQEIYDRIKNILHAISTDTRNLSAGSVFFALTGDTFDGNSYTQEALEKGASWVIVDNPDYQINDRCMLVENVRETLQNIAQIHRKSYSIPVIAIGGSNGKTTTKELIHTVLSKKYAVHTTKGNLNNHIGVPLTLLQLTDDIDIAVIEVGANHPQEHTHLMELVAPTHVLVTNNGADHLEGFGNLDGVRRANTEIYTYAKTHDATIFVNKTIPDLVEDSLCEKQYLYPTKPWVGTSTITTSITYDGTLINSQLFGAYNESNILAAIAVGEYFDIPLPDIRDAIQTYTPTLKRSQVLHVDSLTVVLDCYNANPSSMELALRDFIQTTPKGKRIIVIGDMLEMGIEESRVHKEILVLVQKISDTKDIIICVGPRFGIYTNEFPFMFFETATSAAKQLEKITLTDMYLFLKASRGIKLEDVIKEKISL